MSSGAPPRSVHRPRAIRGRPAVMSLAPAPALQQVLPLRLPVGQHWCAAASRVTIELSDLSGSSGTFEFMSCHHDIPIKITWDCSSCLPVPPQGACIRPRAVSGRPVVMSRPAPTPPSRLPVDQHWLAVVSRVPMELGASYIISVAFLLLANQRPIIFVSGICNNVGARR